MKERLVPKPKTAQAAVHTAGLIISWNAPGHEGEYLVNIPGLFGDSEDSYQANQVARDLRERLTDDWWLANRGSRFEIYDGGRRDDEFVVGAIMQYFDELAEFSE